MLYTGVAPVKELVIASPIFPPFIKEPIPDEATDRPPLKRPDLSASFRLPPPASVPMPPPKKLAPNVPIPKEGPRKGTPNAAAAIGRTIGAAFLTTLATFLTTFLTALKTLLKKNSGKPVTGFMLFNSLPTTNSCGSSPISSIWLKRSSFTLGLASRTSRGMTVSPSAA